MYKQTIKYVDFNGTEREEDYYFHLSLPEVARIEAEIGQPMEEYVKTIVADQDVKVIMAFLEKMILTSHGRKSADGRSFQKSAQIREEFEYSQAYAELFEMFLTQPDLAKKFGDAVSDNGKAKKNQVEPTVVQG